MKKIFLTILLIAGATLSLNAQTIVTSDQTAGKKLPTWRFAIQGGGGYRFGKVPAGLDAAMEDYLKDLRWGYSYGADITGFFSETLGGGVKYHSFNASNKGVLYNSDAGNVAMSDKQNFWFAGPMLSYRTMSASMKNAFYMNLGAGYIGYRDNAQLNSISIVQKGGTLGYVMEFGYDIGLSEHLSIGASMSFFGGSLSSYKNEALGMTETVTLDKNNQESVTHLDLTIGLRYTL